MPRLEADLAEDVNLEKEGGNTYPDGDGEGEEEEEEDSLDLLSTVDYIFLQIRKTHRRKMKCRRSSRWKI